MGWTPISHPAGSCSTTALVGVEKRAWARSWWPKQEPKILRWGCVLYISAENTLDILTGREVTSYLEGR